MAQEKGGEDYGQMYRDFYFGSGKDNPAMVVRVANIESDLRDARKDVQRHADMLEGPTGLDRTMRDFIAEQKGRDESKTQSDIIWRFVIAAAISLLVGLLEWHPWR